MNHHRADYSDFFFSQMRHWMQHSACPHGIPRHFCHLNLLCILPKEVLHNAIYCNTLQHPPPLHTYVYSYILPDPIYRFCSLTGRKISENYFTYRSVQISKSCGEDLMLQDLIPRTRLCGTGTMVLLFSRVGSFVSTWPKWSGRNVLYQLGTSSQKGAYRWGWPLNIFAGCIGSGGNIYVHGFRRHFSHWNLPCLLLRKASHTAIHCNTLATHKNPYKLYIYTRNSPPFFAIESSVYTPEEGVCVCLCVCARARAHARACMCLWVCALNLSCYSSEAGVCGWVCVRVCVCVCVCV